jgi:regulator of sigma E protease
MTWIVVAGGLALLVFLHELGHFTVARLVGMRPRAFYIGFPPAIAKVRRKGIEYGIGAIPLGGYVRIPGMHRPAASDFQALMSTALQEQPGLVPDAQAVRRHLDDEDFAGARDALPQLTEAVADAQLTPQAHRGAERALRDVDEGTGSDAYWRAPTWKRVAVIAAGPGMNVLVAFLIFFAVYATGAPSQNPSAEVAQVDAHTPAAAAGLQAGDRIVAVDGRAARTFDQVSQRIRASRGRPITVTVRRNGSTITLGPRKTIRVQGRWIWGFVPATQLVSYPASTSARLAIGDCWRVVTGTVHAFAGLVHSRQRAQISGPVGIVRASAAFLRIGLQWYLQLLGLISMSLALFNLLPLLPLDGGHILFSVIEGVRRRAVPREVYERVSVFGMALILLISVIAFSNDVGGTPR